MPNNENPFSSQVTNLRDRYFRKPNPATAKLDFPASNPAQTATRGMLIPKIEGGSRAFPMDRTVIFQFNPEQIQYEKQTNRGAYERLGFAYDVPYWISGKAKTISFRLQLDATPGANYRTFRTRKSNDNNSNTTGAPYINFDDLATSGMSEGSLGLLPEIEKLESLMYPIDTAVEDLVQFTNGIPNVDLLNKFSNPPFVIFSYGSVLATTQISSLSRTDNLFNKNLNPTRAEFQVTLVVYEYKVVDTNFIVKPNLRAVSDQTNDTRRFL